MLRRKKPLISISSDEAINFLMPSKDGTLKSLASMPLESFIEGREDTGELPKAAFQSVSRLLIVPDYWVGNSFFEFQARKKSLMAAFIERKLKIEQPALTEISDFYNYSVVQGQDHRQELHARYLREPIAYRLYRRMEAIGISPLQITIPALMWQTKLGDMADGFGEKGVGFIHLGETHCFLYFYFMGQFLFSRRIELPDTDDDASQTYNLLSYEINQSFYLFSQKTKSSVDDLFVLAHDPVAASQLTELLGREVKGVPHLPFRTGMPDGAEVLPSCQGFTAQDLMNEGEHYISYKPLQKELEWRPVQWAGIAVGLFLAVLLTVESSYLYLRSGALEQHMRQVVSADAEPPEMALQNISISLDEITRELAQPSGSGTIMRTLLAMPDGVSVRKISLDVSATPYLKMDAVVNADNPDAFKAILKVFLTQLNHRFNLKTHPIREKDVSIQLDRSETDERKIVYQINFGFEIS